MTEGQEFVAAISFENGKVKLRLLFQHLRQQLTQPSNVARYVNPETKNISADRLITESYKQHAPTS